ncbi:tyrosine--tRNA ligase [Hugenholtzia roseola]|uniref:tyrosine--tRNA ligase n=1 Tax=Hugenholtzia roseola TaxID=1002 RepID=UPI0004264993|nr:tyrosine--tRNA ligase [Hugenholtzia roseola]
MKHNLIEELRWRGMLQDLTPETEEQLQKEITIGYIGFDPTADSLHIGNLATLMLLVQLQRAGHKPIALVGGATGMIGDPSGKSAERNLLDEATLAHNQACITKQLRQFLSFEGENAAEVVNNYDWFKNISFLQFLREAGKHLTVNYMMAKDSVKKRLETGLSFTEFSYQLLQAYDFYWLYENKGVKLQMGGSDQWGNITSGTEFIRRIGGGSAFALTCPLVTKADGTKFGKSEGGNIWLDAQKTSPYQFYQFWLNVADEDAPRMIRVFTLLDQKTIENLEAEHKATPHLRLLQKELAAQVTKMVHGEDALAKAIEASEILFGKATTEILEKLDENTLLEVFKDVPNLEVSKQDFEAAPNVLELLATQLEKQIFPSKGEARKMILGGGVSLNQNKITDPNQALDLNLLQGKYILIQKGKKNYYLLKIIA